jgi:NIMA (never in mitosis gene a)-related kinase
VDLLAKMDSPFVVKYLDSFLDKNCLQIVMEFCNKGDLQRMVKRAVKKELKSLGEKSTWNIILQVREGGNEGGSE